MNELKITIEGPKGIGKTSLANYLTETLFNDTIVKLSSNSGSCYHYFESKKELKKFKKGFSDFLKSKGIDIIIIEEKTLEN